MPHHTTTALATLFAAGLVAAPALADPIVVTSGADDGAGSLRAALAMAAESGDPILVAADEIMIDATLSYDGTLPLTIMGTGTTISSDENVTLLAVTQGADLTLSGLAFEGPGGFSIEARGDADGPSSAGKGIFVDVRDDQTGVVSISLTDVSVTGTAGHGIHVSDCTLADDCGGGSGGAGEGSEASISMVLNGVQIVDSAHGRFDADGLRVDERGVGGITFTAVNSLFERVGADGIELDEGQAGDIEVVIADSAFIGNGYYCHPDLLGAFMPDPDEAEFEEGAMMEDAIPGPITGSPDDQCFEREVSLYDDGSVEEYAFAIDVDDGFDIDEAGPGGMHVVVTGSVMDDNFDEGFDFDEEGPGGIETVFLMTTASGNTDDGYKMSEEDEGGVTGVVFDSTASDNGGVGFVFEEEDEGDVFVQVTGAMTSGNDDGDLGLEVVQDDDGEGELIIEDSAFEDGVEAEGVDIDD